MFITRQSHRTRPQALVSARSRCPYADTPKERGRATGERERRTGDCTPYPPPRRYYGDGYGLNAPFGRGADQFSRHAFLGVIAV